MRLDVRNYFLSFRAVIRLQVFWLLIIILGLILVGIFSVILICYLTSTIVQILIFFSGALVGFGSSAFFSRPQQFLLRGSEDAVYLIENNFWCPHAHKLANSITVDVFGGVWHEIEHVSERMLKTLEFFFGKEELDISKATLCQVGNSIFAVNGTTAKTATF